MDATRLRTLIDAALASQQTLEEAEAADVAAKKAVDDAAARHRQEVGNLIAALNAVPIGAVAYGDRLIRVGQAGNSRGGQWVHVLPLVSVPVIAPLPAPLPEGKPEPAPTATKPVAPPSGKVPNLSAKK